ncbi:MAG: hypothetical protein NC339_00775 [Muribaculaceae bacterium]|nr:hypothetical protein [Muribaculaceae bacterium]
MKKLFRNLMLFMACACMAAPQALADRHRGAQSTPTRTERHSNSGSRGSSGRPGLGGGNNNNSNNNHKPGRPGNNGNHHNNNNRPGNNGNHNPGNNGNHNPGRPGVGGNNRPGNPGKPGHLGRPGQPGRPTPTPPSAHRPGRPRPSAMQPPHRPYRPAIVRPHYRPTPPPSWRPRRGLPVIRGILGLTFGTALGISLDYLYNNGYAVDGYTNDIVYLRNVPALNLVWTDGALYYGPTGLDASTFYYTSPVRDLTRYNQCYNSLVATYGVPVSVNNVGATLSSTWFGGNNGYITLSFGVQNTGRFLTSLTFGM